MKKILAVSATALLAALAVSVPTWAVPTGPDSIRPGKNIGVFHNLDFIAAFGYPVGEKLTIDVYRGDTRIATASGPAVEVNEGLPLNGALEVNHGPEGPPAPGDCWTDYTPDVLPGDRVVVTDASGGTDEVFVDNITINPEGPQLDPLTGDITIRGTASYGAAGEAIPVALLDSGDLRLGSDYRATPDEVAVDSTVENGWKATYRQDQNGEYNWYKNPAGLDSEQQKQAILDGDHAMGYGHVAPLPPETQLVEGIGGGGPALGCENLAPAAGGNAMSVVSPDSFNQATAVGGNVAVSGVIQDTVDVSLSLNDPNNTVPVTENANGTWTATIPAANLQEGDNTLTAAFSGAVTKSQTKKVTLDTTAPSFNQSLVRTSGTYNGAFDVSLNTNDPNATIFYTRDGTNPATSNSRVRYQGGPIRINTGQTLFRAVAFDAVNNASVELSRQYTVRAATSTSLVMNTNSIKLNTRKAISGAVSPANSGNTVKLTIARPGADLVRTLSLVNGRYSFSYKATVLGIHRVSVSFAQDADSQGSTSVAKTFRVIR